MVDNHFHEMPRATDNNTAGAAAQAETAQRLLADVYVPHQALSPVARQNLTAAAEVTTAGVLAGAASGAIAGRGMMGVLNGGVNFVMHQSPGRGIDEALVLGTKVGGTYGAAALGTAALAGYGIYKGYEHFAKGK